MKLHCKITNTKYEFVPVRLSFKEELYRDTFAQKNNKTVLDTIGHRRYAKLRQEVEKSYPSRLHEALGSFLLDLKRSGVPLYRKFLNDYGDKEYSIFQIGDEKILDKCGVYAYTVNNELNYIGRCRDSMRKRVNQGYGKIHPKNCYIDGQSTNCRINALITVKRESVQLWFCEVDSTKIEQVEKELIREYVPLWNIYIVSSSEFS